MSTKYGEKSAWVFLAKVGALRCACCASRMLFKILAPWKEKNVGRGHSLPSLIKEKEKHWLRSAASPLHHKATKQKVLMGLPRWYILLQLSCPCRQDDPNVDLEDYWNHPAPEPGCEKKEKRRKTT
eukprot:1151400-Pelagomonas_calceolata.AAC.1